MATIASTILLTFYRVSPKRGNLPDNVTGIVANDHWKPYYTLKGVSHALCHAHHLHELQALVEIKKRKLDAQDATSIATGVSHDEACAGTRCAVIAPSDRVD